MVMVMMVMVIGWCSSPPLRVRLYRNSLRNGARTQVCPLVCWLIPTYVREMGWERSISCYTRCINGARRRFHWTDTEEGFINPFSSIYDKIYIFCAYETRTILNNWYPAFSNNKEMRNAIRNANSMNHQLSANCALGTAEIDSPVGIAHLKGLLALGYLQARKTRKSSWTSKATPSTTRSGRLERGSLLPTISYRSPTFKKACNGFVSGCQTSKTSAVHIPYCS